MLQKVKKQATVMEDLDTEIFDKSLISTFGLILITRSIVGASLMIRHLPIMLA